MQRAALNKVSKNPFRAIRVSDGIGSSPNLRSTPSPSLLTRFESVVPESSAVARTVHVLRWLAALVSANPRDGKKSPEIPCPSEPAVLVAGVLFWDKCPIASGQS